MAHTKIPTGNEDVNVFRCKRCGQWCDLVRDKTGPGEGIRYESITHTADTAPDNPIVTRGCPYCGTLNYQNWNR